MQILNEKLIKSTKSASDSQNGSINKWRDRSKVKFEKLKQDEENNLLLKLELYNKKQNQSTINHSKAIEIKSRNVNHHNIKVDKMRNNISFKINEEEQVTGILAKNYSASYKREKRKHDMNKKFQDRKLVSLEKRIKFDMIKAEEQEVCNKKLENLEKKYFKSVEVIRQNKSNWKSNLEIKQEKEKLKIEDWYEKLERIKRLELKNKEEIIKKHVDIANRLKDRKNIQEKSNEKLRDSVMKESIERERASLIKLKICKSKTPINFQSVISEFDSKP
jgi:hypothetical protein